MSAYDNDWRVQPLGPDHFIVTPQGGLEHEVYRWTGDTAWSVALSGQVIASPFDTADEAIRFLIGDPQ